jgi:Rad3-related DNA helicase
MFRTFKELNSILNSLKTKKQKASFKLILSISDGAKELKICCLDPSWTLTKILNKNPHCLLITSGTITPFHDYENESGVIFPIKFSSRHIISSNAQVNFNF